MQLFIDTAKVDEVKEAWSWGIIDGVTTNPSHIAVTGRRWRDVVDEICAIVSGPVSVEVVATEYEAMLKEAREIAAMHPQIVVKIPLIRDGIKVIKVLSQEGIRTNCTLNFTPLQALLAAKVGATYISPFVGRLDAVGHNGMDLVRDIRTIYDNYGFETKVLAAAIRHPVHVLEAALAGADVATMNFAILDQLYHHPLTDAGLASFLEDWKKVPQ